MTAIELKRYIYDNNKVESILEEIGCHHINGKSNKEWRCGEPNRNSKSCISIKKNEFLGIKMFKSTDAVVRGDFITLIMEILGLNFVNANKYLHKLLGLKYNFKKGMSNKTKKTPLDIFKNRKSKNFNINDFAKIYDENVLYESVRGLHIDWFKEGIMPFTANVFKLGYDIRRKRISIPHTKWDGGENDILGVMGRTTIENYDILDINKYMPLIPFPKGINLYGLRENYKSIQEAGYVVVHEAEKSVLRRHSRLDGTGVAICCHDFDDMNKQVAILIGLNVEIIISMDEGVDINHVRSMCNNFYGIRRISYIWDKYGILKEKEAPADKTDKIYKYLLKHRINYDIKERKEYLKWLEKQKTS